MTIRIFVGCAANNEDLESQAVCEFTLRKYSSEDIDIEWMMQSRNPESFWHGWNTTGWATPFSGFRWGIPARCNFEGRAIYMDSDMIVRDDIAKLYHHPIPMRSAIIAKGTMERYCVMVMDCGKLKGFMRPIEMLKSDPVATKQQRKKISGKVGLVQPFANGNWNCLDGEKYENLDDPDIKCLHYTDIDTQPQLKYALPRLAREGQEHWFKGKPKPHRRADIVDLFDRTLREAIAAGFKPENYRRAPFGSYTEGTCIGGNWVRPVTRQMRQRGRVRAA